MNNIEKRTLEDIINDSKTINAKLVAEEILTWTINNVENFIDNEEKIFQISLTIDSTEGMVESQRLQNLYRAIPEDEDFVIAGGFSVEERLKPTKDREKEFDNLLAKISDCRNILDDIVKDCHIEMKNRKDLSEILFKKMAFYYEKVIPNQENKKKAQEIDAELRRLVLKKEKESDEKVKETIQQEIIKLINEGVGLIKFTEKKGKIEVLKFEYEGFEVNVEIKNNKQEKVRDYVVPEGFIIWLQIDFDTNLRPTSIF